MGGGTLLLLACAPAPIFPPEVLEQVDRTVSFQHVVDHPAAYQGRVGEFGGDPRLAGRGRRGAGVGP